MNKYVLKGDNDLQVSPELGSEVSVIQLYPSSIHTAAEKIQAVLDGKSSETVELKRIFLQEHYLKKRLKHKFNKDF